MGRQPMQRATLARGETMKDFTRTYIGAEESGSDELTDRETRIVRTAFFVGGLFVLAVTVLHLAL